MSADNLFQLHTKGTAPKASLPLFDNSMNAFGMIPNLHAVMAESPELLEAYQVAHQLFLKTSFSEEELTVVWQTINVEHDCHYCVPAHSAIASGMNVDPDINQALLDETPLPESKLEALRDFTLHVIRLRGQLDQQVIDDFLDAGYTTKNILEVILGVSQKVMSNYTNHIAKTPLDKAFMVFDTGK